MAFIILVSGELVPVPFPPVVLNCSWVRFKTLHVPVITTWTCKISTSLIACGTAVVFVCVLVQEVKAIELLALRFPSAWPAVGFEVERFSFKLPPFRNILPVLPVMVALIWQFTEMVFRSICVALLTLMRMVIRLVVIAEMDNAVISLVLVPLIEYVPPVVLYWKPAGRSMNIVRFDWFLLNSAADVSIIEKVPDTYEVGNELTHQL